MTVHEKFVEDMDGAGIHTEGYLGRFFWEGPAARSDEFHVYEEVVLRRRLDRGCVNNILIVDAGMCAEAFASEDTRRRRAGRNHTLIPVRV